MKENHISLTDSNTWSGKFSGFMGLSFKVNFVKNKVKNKDE